MKALSRRTFIGWLAVAALLLTWTSVAQPVHADDIVLNPLTGAPVDQALRLSVGANPDAAMAAAGGTPVVQQFQETSYSFKDLACRNANACLAVGAPHWDNTQKAFRATITKSIDGGRTWHALDAGTAPTLMSVAFPDEQHAWTVGEHGVILHTSDGGASWARQSIPTDDTLLSVAFADAQHGWIGSMRPVAFWTSDGTPRDWRATIWRTSDGGATWVKGSLPPDAALIQDIDVLDARHAWAVGLRTDPQRTDPENQYPAVYKTMDGGLTWLLVYSPQISISLTAVDFIDPLHGWVSGFPYMGSVTGGATYRTTDGGVTWERESPGQDIYEPIFDIRFADANRGYAVGLDYVSAWGAPVWRTLDGGATWTKILMGKRDNEGLFGVAVSVDRVVALGDWDYLAFSDDPWAACSNVNCDSLFTQRYLNTHYIFHDVDFANSSAGWAAGSKTLDVGLWGQTIFHTPDGGVNWTEQLANPPSSKDWSYHRLDSIDMVDTQVGWAVGTAVTWAVQSGWQAHGGIWRTTDGGKHWIEQGLQLFGQRSGEFSAVQALSASEAWALAEDGGPNSQHVFLAHTTDGGEQWQWVDTGIEGAIAVGFGKPQGAIKFTDAQHGWVAGWNVVLRTEDGGAHWSKAPLSCGSSLCYPSSQAIDFAGSRGWIAGEYLWRNDDGSTWVRTSTEPHAERGLSKWFYGVQFLDDKNGWVVGNGGSMLFTTSGGDRWSRMPYATYYDIRGLHFLSSTTGWVVGDAGVIFMIALSQFPPMRWTYLPLLAR